MWESESESAAGADYGGRALSNSKHGDGGGVQTDGFEQRGQSWHVSTDIPSDLLVQIGDVSFHLHKYPLLSRSARMNRIIYESREGEVKKISLDDLPGGAEAFELAAKFCYGIAVDLTATSISGLRCGAEYLEMTEDLEEGNLIFKTEAFLSYVVLSSWRDSIVVLKSCENLSPWAENLQIVRRCSESIAWKACANPKGIRWQYTSTGKPKWTELKDSSSPSRNAHVPADWWFEDVSILRIDHFVRVITAIKVKGMRYELVGAAIMHYASKWLPGLMKEKEGEMVMMSSASASASDINISSISNGGAMNSWKGGLHMIVSAGNQENVSKVQAKDQRMIVESLISIIPQQRDGVSCSFLLRLLRMANMLKVAPALVTELEKRVGMQLEQATLGDLLIPCYNSNCKSEATMYDVDLVQRVLEHFLVQEQSESSTSPSSSKMRVARLVDSYLTEVARDRNLSLTKFQVLGEALPESARTCDDGLYRAVDSYLKAHPTVTEHERKRLCRVMDCQKLSIDACMHAAQNERLPLRVVVQVLFSEQVKISNALANRSLNEGGSGDQSQSQSQYQPLMVSNRKTLLEGTPQSFQEGWSAAKKDINSLKFEIESVRAKYLELQHEMDTLQHEFNKLAKPTKQTSPWTSAWKKKLTKLTRMADNNNTTTTTTDAPEHTRKTPRRWRNSIS